MNTHNSEEAVSLPPIDPLVSYFNSMAEYFGMCRSKAQQLMNAGTVKTVKIGRKVQIRRSEIIRLQAAYEAKMGVAA